MLALGGTARYENDTRAIREWEAAAARWLMRELEEGSSLGPCEKKRDGIPAEDKCGYGADRE